MDLRLCSRYEVSVEEEYLKAQKMSYCGYHCSINGSEEETERHERLEEWRTTSFLHCQRGVGWLAPRYDK